ncbi:MAG: hypothetical protein ACJA2S_005567 [Cyclobacteriaceae bacterium]|jgi:hypothetical protein
MPKNGLQSYELQILKSHIQLSLLLFVLKGEIDKTLLPISPRSWIERRAAKWLTGKVGYI